MELTDLDEFLRKVPKSMDKIGKSVAESIVTRIQSRLARMIEIGIGYLSIDRPTRRSRAASLSASRCRASSIAT